MSKKDLADILTQKPVKEKGINKAHHPRYPKDFVHQADLLFMPHDGKYKYILTVVDNGTRQVDAEPLSSKKAKQVTKAIEVIYDRDVLKKPDVLQVDDGKEFKGDFQTWCKDNNISVRVAKPQRHCQQAIVENKNKVIAKKLFRRMLQQELITGVQSNSWVSDLENVIKEINEEVSKKKIRKLRYANIYRCMGDECNLLDEGQKVRVQLDAPRDVLSGKKLHGKFHETDVRWSVQPHTITKANILPGSPVLYNLENDDSVAYTKNQLMPYNEEQVKEQGYKVIRPVGEKEGYKIYVAEKIVDKRKFRNRIEYLVKWEGFPSSANTWETAVVMREDAPELVDEFEGEPVKKAPKKASTKKTPAKAPTKPRAKTRVKRFNYF